MRPTSMISWICNIYVDHLGIIITTHPILYLSGFGITVDIEDESSGTWMPIPPNRQSVPTQDGM